MDARDLAASSSRTAAAAPPKSGPVLAPSAISARYRSLFVIGRGGMGNVEAALEIGGNRAGREGRPERESGGAFQRVVALKRLLPDAARDARRVEMFLREAKLAAMLDHPNVVRAFDYGEIDGELFFAMEYVEGQALSRFIKSLAEANVHLGVSLAAHVLAEVCDGLHAAHELRDSSGQPLNLVHRDVSPQNVMLAYDGHVRLLDFGVAKIEAESVTKTGEVKGKTAYMSPEQAMGDALDRRSDLFGVGALLFECLTLRRMWGDGTDMDVIRKLALEKPPRLEDVLPETPREVCALYMRLVSREAKDRPATAADVAKELRAFVPQGREEAARALRKLLDAHFHEQAESQRRQLTQALEEVAPDQARELRESVLPATQGELAEALASTSRRNPAGAVSSSALIAEATGANPTSNESRSAGVASPTKESRSWLPLAAAALALSALLAWRLSASPQPIPPAPPPPSPSVSPPVSSALSLPPSLSPAPAPSLSPAPAPAPSLAPGPSARILAQPTPGPRPVPSPSTSAKPLPSPPPSPSTKRPPDVDDHPF